MSRPKIGAVLARLQKLSYPMYCLDFTEHLNEYDSDDEGNEFQWSHPIRFEFRNGCFLNREDIPYNTNERYTAKVFWEDQSTSIDKMVEDTMRVRRARGEVMPRWSVGKMCNAADQVWYKMSR